MVVVLFEVVVKPECLDRYLEVAASLKDALDGAEGFVRSERFSSLNERGKLLSLSVWRDEASVERWRNQIAHRAGQGKGRRELFERYTITVLSPLRHYSLSDRNGAPQDSRELFG